MTEKICPFVKEPCIGIKCSEFVSPHNYIGDYNIGIQDYAIMLWYWLRRIEYKEPHYKGTICAHCRLKVISASRWDSDEYKEEM